MPPFKEGLKTPATPQKSLKKRKSDLNQSRTKQNHPSLSPETPKLFKNDLSTSSKSSPQSSAASNSKRSARKRDTSKENQKRFDSNDGQILSSSSKSKRRRQRKKQLAATKRKSSIESLAVDSGITDDSSDENEVTLEKAEDGACSDLELEVDSAGEGANDETQEGDLSDEDDGNEGLEGSDDESGNESDSNIDENTTAEVDNQGAKEEKITSVKPKKHKADSKVDREERMKSHGQSKDIVNKTMSSSGETQFIVFLTNIPFTATEEDLREHFKNIPFIGNITMMKEKGTGKSLGRATMEMNNFVSYAKALAMHKSQMKGRPIFVAPDKSMPKGFSKGLVQTSEHDYRVIVSRLPQEMNIKELKDHFSTLGHVKRFIIPPVTVLQDGQSSRAWVLELGNLDLFEKVLQQNGSQVGGQSIKVEPLSFNTGEETKPRKSEVIEYSSEKPGTVDKALGSDETSSKPSFSVLVKNIPLSLKMKKIKQHFLVLGDIKSFTIPSSSKNAEDAECQRTLILEVDEEDLYKKLLQLNGSLIAEQSIEVEPLEQPANGEKTKKRKADRTDSESPVKKSRVEDNAQDGNDVACGKDQFEIFVKSVPLTATKEDLRDLFSKAGKVVRCCVYEPHENSGKSFKSAYVKIAGEGSFSAAMALNGSTLQGVKIFTQPFKKQIKKKRFVVFVGNLPFSTTGEDVKRHFNDVGRIVDVRLPLSKENKPGGYAYVEFADQASYEKSLSLHHSFLNGRRINVEYSTSQRKSGDRKPKTSAVKHKLFKLQTLSQNQQLQQQNPDKKKSKPSKKRRNAHRLKKSQD